MAQLNFDISEAVRGAISESPEEFIREMRIAAAAKWYELGRLSQGKAAEVAGLSRSAFLDALSRFKVSPWQYTAAEIADELTNLE
jgi:predicted HTH domain antitoxin